MKWLAYGMRSPSSRSLGFGLGGSIVFGTDGLLDDGLQRVELNERAPAMAPGDACHVGAAERRRPVDGDAPTCVLLELLLELGRLYCFPPLEHRLGGEQLGLFSQSSDARPHLT